AAVADDERQLRDGQAVVERDEDEAGPLGRHLDLGVLELVLGQERQPVAGGEASGEEGRRQCVGLPVELGERAGAAALPDGVALGEPSGRVAHQVGYLQGAHYSPTTAGRTAVHRSSTWRRT